MDYRLEVIMDGKVVGSVVGSAERIGHLWCADDDLVAALDGRLRETTWPSAGIAIRMIEAALDAKE